MKKVVLLLIICFGALSVSACFPPRPLKKVPLPGKVIKKPPLKPPVPRP